MKIKSQCCCDQKREQIKGKSGAVAARLENFFHDDDCDCDDRDDGDDGDRGDGDDDDDGDDGDRVQGDDDEEIDPFYVCNFNKLGHPNQFSSPSD